jgi:hypothetical protein
MPRVHQPLCAPVQCLKLLAHEHAEGATPSVLVASQVEEFLSPADLSVPPSFSSTAFAGPQLSLCSLVPSFQLFLILRHPSPTFHWSCSLHLLLPPSLLGACCLRPDWWCLHSTQTVR